MQLLYKDFFFIFKCNFRSVELNCSRQIDFKKNFQRKNYFDNLLVNQKRKAVKEGPFVKGDSQDRQKNKVTAHCHLIQMFGRTKKKPNRITQEVIIDYFHLFLTLLIGQTCRQYVCNYPRQQADSPTERRRDKNTSLPRTRGNDPRTAMSSVRTFRSTVRDSDYEQPFVVISLQNRTMTRNSQKKNTKCTRQKSSKVCKLFKAALILWSIILVKYFKIIPQLN